MSILTILIIRANQKMNECECPSIYDMTGQTAEKAVEKILGIKNFFCNEFIYGGHLLSFGTSLIALSTMILLGITIRWEFLLIIYFGTQCIYNYDHFKEIDADTSNNSDRTNHLKKYQKFLPSVLVVYGISYFVLLLGFGNIESIIFGSILLFSGLLYTDKFKMMTEKIVGFKSVYTASSWGLLVVFTAIYCSYALNALLAIILLFVFLRWLVNTSFCDLKDMDSDKKENLLTLPIYFGKQKFIIFLHILNLSTFLLLLIAIILGIAPLFSAFLLFFYAYGFYYIQKAKNLKTNLNSLSNIMVDGEFMFWPVFLLLGSFFITLV